MEFPFFTKGQKKEPKAVAKKEEKAGTLVPIEHEREDAGTSEPKKTQTPKQKTWRNFPVGSNALLARPITTEKAMKLSAMGKYAFEVARGANKLSIRKAFFNAYGVMPSKIAVIRQEGKVVRYGRYAGKRRDVKKALITVPKGKHIDIGI